MFKKQVKKQTDKVVDDGDVVINLRESSVNEFTQRNLPGDDKLEEFEDYFVGDVKEEPEKDDGDSYFSQDNEVEIEESLNEIYQDDDGKMVDVKKFKSLKKRGFFFWLIVIIFVFGVLGGGTYYVYDRFLLGQGMDAAAVDFTIESKNEVIAGEEFFYTVNYGNSSMVNLKNATVAVTYPENFVYLGATPEASDKNSRWDVGDIKTNSSGKIKIKGMIIGEEGKSGVLSAKMDYMPENFSSQFNKTTSATTRIKDVGINFDFDYSSNVLVDEESDLSIRFNARENNYINDFRISQEVNEDMKIIDSKSKLPAGELAKFTVIRPGVWQVDEVGPAEKILPIKFKFSKKGIEGQKIVFNFEKLVGDSQYVKFYSKEIQLDVIKSDLNLTMIINGKRDDQGVNFGDTLNYSLVYKNGGDSEMKDVVLMAVLDSDFLDWTSLNDPLKGKEKGNTIIWTKDEIPDLASIAPNKEGVVDFSIKLISLKADKLTNDQKYSVTSFAHFAVGANNDSAKDKVDNKSNTIVNNINSDLKLSEQVLYFNSDNVPVGSGPNPPKVGEETSYKVYWKLTNSLHELGDVKVTVKLPDYVNYAGKPNFTVGSLVYNEATREVSWMISRLPVLDIESTAEFNISIRPADADKNKIMILLPGSTISAIDNITKSNLTQATKAKTSKLEDDEIAGGSGIVE